MKQETYERMFAEVSRWEKGWHFIQRLVELGVPVSAIMTNDWESVLPQHRKVYLTIPYGAKKSAGTVKAYSRCSVYDIQKAVKFWRESVEA